MMRRVKSPGAEEATVSSWVGPAASLLGIGWFFATAILLGVGVGLWVDSLTGLEPTFTIVGIVAGLGIALVGGFRMLQQVLRRLSDESPPKGST